MGNRRTERHRIHDRVLACEAAILIYEAQQRREAVAVEPQPRRLVLPELTPRLKSFGAFGVLAASHLSLLDFLSSFFS